MRRYKPQRLTILNVETGEIAEVSRSSYLRCAYAETRQRLRHKLRISKLPYAFFYLNGPAFDECMSREASRFDPSSRSEC